MSGKRSVHTDALATLGTIITADEKRDAIHVAVFPCQAGEMLRPGDHVALNAQGEAINAPAGEGLGIADPFLTSWIKEGQWFWLLVYPRQITSLRHVWEHPSFPASSSSWVQGDQDVILLDAVREDAREDKGISEAWLRDWIDSADCPGFETTIAAMLDQRYSEYVHFYGSDAHGEIPAEAWYHLGIYSGEDLSGDRPSYFSCSC